MSAIKATAEDAASSAKAGVAKAKATADEKVVRVEKAKTRDPLKKREVEEDKEDRKLQIESDERVEKAAHGPERTVAHTAEFKIEIAE
ncbi:hypothetical protein Zm00014a_040294 [Zea mays]|uniref:Uncharacterized protein n=1 Tax=Zea mays TaxID=4577 RepID=A0A3L6DC49_MAIZE|nr:hypothetical protein Zm00014a_040294 [Zea mays]